MNTRIKTIITVALFISFIAIAYIAYTTLSDKFKPNTNVQNEQSSTGQSQSSKTEIKHKAPDFTILDYKGKRVKLSDLNGA